MTLNDILLYLDRSKHSTNPEVLRSMIKQYKSYATSEEIEDIVVYCMRNLGRTNLEVITSKLNVITEPLVPHNVGGRIFYDAGDNGATYKFYDASGNEITTQTVAGLANAVTYTVAGTPTNERWYAWNSSGSYYGTWGKSGVDCGMNNTGIGGGKLNSAIMMELEPDGTAWTWLKNTMNGQSIGGCNDWFIPTKEEMAVHDSSGTATSQYRPSGAIPRTHGASAEVSSTRITYYSPDGKTWTGNEKTAQRNYVAMRSF